MPYIQVPLDYDDPTCTTRIRLSYTLVGASPHLVVFIPGLCVPSSMFEGVCTLLVSTTQFSTLSIDNRGIGRSDIPPATLLRGGVGYSVTTMARDAWRVIDSVFKLRGLQPGLEERRGGRRRRVALVGHSMGGMVVQTMLRLRPRDVAFIALLSTHAGGWWNLLPTIGMLRSLTRVAWSGFDPHVQAAVTLDMQYSQKFLHDSISADDFLSLVQATPIQPPHAEGRDVSLREGSELLPSLPLSETTDGGLRRRHPPSDSPPLQQWQQPQQQREGQQSQPYATQTQRYAASSFARGLSYVESKMIDFARDAHVYFGLSVTSFPFPHSLRHPKQFLLDAITKRTRWLHVRTPRFRRWDVYHAFYAGLEDDDGEKGHGDGDDKNDVNEKDGNIPTDNKDTLMKQRTLKDRSAETVSQLPPTSDILAGQETREPTPYAYFGHMAVVRSHTLPRGFARAVRECSTLVKLVIIGRHDNVITPSASRALAATIDANTVVELDAAHFVTEEACAEVATHIVYGLRKAFFAPNGRPCSCAWCVEAGVSSIVDDAR